MVITSKSKLRVTKVFDWRLVELAASNLIANATEVSAIHPAFVLLTARKTTLLSLITA
jgi:hypothetical protein